MDPVTMHCPVLILHKHYGARADQGGPDGAFRLVLRAFHQLPDRRGFETFVATWIGPAAAAWWGENKTMPGGTPLRLDLANPRTVVTAGAFGKPEIHATVLRCERLPPAHHKQTADHGHPVARAASTS